MWLSIISCLKDKKISDRAEENVYENSNNGEDANQATTNADGSNWTAKNGEKTTGWHFIDYF